MMSEARILITGAAVGPVALAATIVVKHFTLRQAGKFFS